MELDTVFKDLEKTLANMIEELEPVPYEVAAAVKCDIVAFDGTEVDNARWRTLMAEHLETAKTFEIHCWTEEQEEIALALQYGTVKPDKWKYGTIITGTVTAQFKELLLNLPKPLDTASGYNKMTPFFSIMLDNGFSSEHYGTENIISMKT